MHTIKVVSPFPLGIPILKRRCHSILLYNKLSRLCVHSIRSRHTAKQRMAQTLMSYTRAVDVFLF